MIYLFKAIFIGVCGVSLFDTFEFRKRHPEDIGSWVFSVIFAILIGVVVSL